MKANTTPYRQKIKDKKGKTKYVKLQNYFEIYTDNAGFICNTVDQKRNYQLLAKDDSVFKIIITGNSVTAGSGTSSPEKIWCSQLEHLLNQEPDILHDKFKSIAVINSSTLGHKFTQEVRRFEDELCFLNPHLVLTLSGGLANYDYVGNPIDDSNHDIQNYFNRLINFGFIHSQDIVFPAIINWHNHKNELSKAFYYHNHDYISVTAADVTSKKIKQMHGICKSCHAEYLFFLQPTMGIGEKQLSKSEQNMVKNFKRFYSKMDWNDYVFYFKQYTKNITSQVNETYFHNLLDVFSGYTQTTYSDPRHQNNFGHEVLAENITPIVRETIIKLTNS